MKKIQKQPLPLIIQNSNKNLNTERGQDQARFSLNQSNISRESTKLGSFSLAQSPRGGLFNEFKEGNTKGFSVHLQDDNHKRNASYLNADSSSTIFFNKSNHKDNQQEWVNEVNFGKDLLKSQDDFLKTEGSKFRIKNTKNNFWHNNKTKKLRKEYYWPVHPYEHQDKECSFNQESSPMSPFPITRQRFIERSENPEILKGFSLSERRKDQYQGAIGGGAVESQQSGMTISLDNYPNTLGSPQLKKNEFFITKQLNNIQKKRATQLYIEELAEISEQIKEGNSPVKATKLNLQKHENFKDPQTEEGTDRKGAIEFDSDDEEEELNRDREIRVAENYCQIGEMYQQIEKLHALNKHFGHSEPLEHRYLRACDSEGLLPRKLGIIPAGSPRKQVKVLDLSRQNLSDKYVSVVAQAMKHTNFDHLQSLVAVEGNIQEKGVKKILNRLPHSIKNLDLTHNRFTRSSCESLTVWLGQKEYDSLKYLNLEGNGLKDAGAISLLQQMSEYSNLSILNLSRNYITDETAVKAIGHMLKDNRLLEEFYLHFNLIKSKGATSIAEGLKENISLRVLDLSFNNIGSRSGDVYGKLKGALLLIQAISHSENCPLLHLDLSYNQIGIEESKQCDIVLKQNQWTFGIHFQGNCGVVADARGHLQFPSIDDLVDQTIRRGNTKQRVKGLKQIRKESCQGKNFQVSDVCWICDGWQQVVFSCQFEGDHFQQPYFLHLGFEDFSPTLLKRRETAQGNRHHEYYARRMCPPDSQVLYFFSCPTQNQTIINIKQKQIALRALVRDNYQLLHKKLVVVTFNEGTTMTLEIPSSLNAWYTSNLQTALFDDYLNPRGECRPRQLESPYVIGKEVKIEWSLPISLFQDWQAETPAMTDACFEVDWNNSQIGKIVKFPDDLEKLKKILRHHYDTIQNMYKVLASSGGVGDVPSISTNVLTDFTMSTRAIDNQLLKLADIDFNMVAVNSGPAKEKTALNPDRQLVRHQLLQILVRLATDKYVKSGETKSCAEAVLRLLERDGLLSRMDEEEDQQNWRETRYWNMECDYLLKDRLEYIKQMYDRFAGSRLSDQKGFMSIQRMYFGQFKDLITYYQLTSVDNLVERDIGVAFHLSMMPQVDELFSDRHTQMHLVEFLQALARIAEQLSLVSPQNQEYQDYSYDERNDLPLHVKLDGLFFFMANPHLLKRDTNERKNINNINTPKNSTTPGGAGGGGGTSSKHARNQYQSANSFMSAVNIAILEKQTKQFQRKSSQMFNENGNSFEINQEPNQNHGEDRQDQPAERKQLSKNSIVDGDLSKSSDDDDDDDDEYESNLGSDKISINDDLQS